jgi:hypothetical protein
MISLDEQITFTTNRANAPLYTESARLHHSAILASLKELKRIKELMREPSAVMLTESGPMRNYDVHAAGASPDADHVEWWRFMSAALLAQVEREIRDE